MAEKSLRWEKAEMEVFWGEIAPHHHLVQIYEDQDVFIGTLTDFVVNGILLNESVIIIATTLHLTALKTHLVERDIDFVRLEADGQLILRDAEEALGEFMVDGWPDKELFRKMVYDLVSRGREGNRKVRAFGEMVALLWARGDNGATVQLEHLWDEFCRNEAFYLLCAYPRSGFTEDATQSLQNICAAHSMILEGSRNKSGNVVFRCVA